jgi:hypothetical protein
MEADMRQKLREVPWGYVGVAAEDAIALDQYICPLFWNSVSPGKDDSYFIQ